MHMQRGIVSQGRSEGERRENRMARGRGGWEIGMWGDAEWGLGWTEGAGGQEGSEAHIDRVLQGRAYLFSLRKSTCTDKGTPLKIDVPTEL